MRRFLALLCGLVLVAGAAWLLLRSGPKTPGEEIDDVSRARLEQVLHDAERRGESR